MRKNVIATLLTFFLAGVDSLDASGFCQQSFDLWGATVGDTIVLKYSEYVGGDCDWYRIYTITIDSSGIIDEDVKRDVFINLPLWPDSIYQGKRMQRIISLNHKDDGFQLPGFATVSPPAFDSTFWPKHNDFLYYMKFDTLWKIFDPPLFSVDAELLWKSPNAVYKNYDISAAYFLFESKHLVLIINQPMTAPGYDTLHGLIIYQLYVRRQGSK